MKKKTFFLSLFTGALALAALASCNVKSKDNKTNTNTWTRPVTTDTGTTPVTTGTTPVTTGTTPVTTFTIPVITTNVENNKVTEEVFNSYFGSYEDSLDKLNISYTYKETGGPVYAEGEFKLADHLILNDFKSDDDIPKRLFNQFGLNADSNKVNVIASNKTADSEWGELVESEKSIGVYKDFVYLPLFNFDDFIYNENKGTYDVEHQDGDEVEYADISIKFVNNKLVSWNYVTIIGLMRLDVSCKVTQIGGVEIQNPTACAVSEDTFKSYFGSDLDVLKKMNLTVNYNERSNSGAYEGTMEVANQMAMDTFDGDSSDGKVFFYFDDYDSSSDKLYISSTEGDLSGENWESLYDSSISMRQFKDRLYLPIFDINDFTYSEVTGLYTASSITVDEVVYNNVSIRFINDELYSYSYGFVDDTYVSNITCKITDIGNTSVTNPCPTVVTKRTFDKYFGMTSNDLENLNITLEYSAISSTVSYDGTIQYADGLRLDTYVKKTATTSVEMIEMFYIKSISDNVKYDYYVYQTSWSQKYTETNSFNVFMANVMCMPLLDFSKLTYNEETGAYEAASIDTSYAGTITNISIKFNNNKLVSYECTYKWYGNVTTFTINVSKIGETTVVDPLADLSE